MKFYIMVNISLLTINKLKMLKSHVVIEADCMAFDKWNLMYLKLYTIKT